MRLDVKRLNLTIDFFLKNDIIKLQNKEKRGNPNMNRLVYAELDNKGNINGIVVNTLEDARKLREIEGLVLKPVLIAWDGMTDEERAKKAEAGREHARKYAEALKNGKVVKYENLLQYCNDYARAVKRA